MVREKGKLWDSASPWIDIKATAKLTGESNSSTSRDRQFKEFAFTILSRSQKNHSLNDVESLFYHQQPIHARRMEK